MASRRDDRQAEIRLQVMRLISAHPQMSSRQVADKVGISNGSAYYVLSTLVEKGFIKLDSFQSSKNKLQYAYVVTPKGIREKVQLTLRFIDRKRQEFEALQTEIRILEEEASLAGEAIPSPRKLK